MLSNLITSLCEFLSVDGIESDSDGVFDIVFDGGLNVSFAALSRSQVLIRSELATLPVDADERETVLRDYLQANMLLLKDQQNSLSLDTEAGKIWLYRIVLADRISVHDFSELLSVFVVTLEWWQGRGPSSIASTSAMDLMPHNFIRP